MPPTEADFSAPRVADGKIDVTFTPTGRRYIFAHRGAAVSPEPPQSDGEYWSFNRWEVDWLARKVAEAAVSATRGG